MSVEELSPREVEHVIKKNKIVLVEYTTKTKREARYFHSLVKDFSFKVLNKIRVVSVNVDNYPEVKSKENILVLPCLKLFFNGESIWEQEGCFLKLFFNGESIWEQEGCFMDYAKDMLILRRSIREALKDKGLRIRI
ncbi:MAG: hypothetical protein B6U76_11750 [Desulfurococcales archaeon ex4484_217_2]|nr:MAG: hypothetical protein B6U76_11750 [Desulfurococcales archaeon ex4484_217_2]